jgi:hypothetical protein
MTVQRHEELPVTELPGQDVGRVHRQSGLADPSAPQIQLPGAVVRLRLDAARYRTRITSRK